MSAAVRPSAAQESQLMVELWDPRIKDDPEAFVLFAFPWGKPGTPLEHVPGPRRWQRKILQKMAAHIRENQNRVRRGQSPEVLRVAIASGRGIGKSALVAWLNLWMMSCHIGSSSVTTANSEAQLKTKTWAELGKWHTLAINSHWFERTALSLTPLPWFKEALARQLKIDPAYYYANALLWSAENPDAFAGAHNMNGVLLVFDEASGIPEIIWTVSEGFFTEPTVYRFWFVFSNPRRNTGPFFECFHKARLYWNRENIDSRTVEGTDVAVLNKIIEMNGEDSDAARVEVKGEFPRQGDRQFISREVIRGALEREVVPDDHAALMMGVDPARYGDDSTVIRFRQGRNGRVIPPVELRGKDNMEVANICAEMIEKYNPDAVCVDVGNGSGIIDRLRERGFKIHEVAFGTTSSDPSWANLRTECWDRVRQWLAGGCIDANAELIDDLAAPEYKFQGSSDKIRLETKEEMRARGLSSPDHGDALACTFAIKVARKDTSSSRGFSRRSNMASGIDYL